ncbi:hypothetical protein B0H19DRAFT_1348812 [Mycena capillaripes]|nr:hypothetical protein B0H19DRAFT_1348812 [Mycena capillaripes]
MRPKTKAEGAATFVHAVSGTCGAGGMLAIIGGRGSGKTTLLNAIAGRLQGLPILEGKISFQPATQFGQNAVKDGAPKVSDIIGFFGQNDYFLPHLTVRETLTFSAALRLPKAVDNNTVRQIVNQTIEELGLKECADTVVGGIFRKGISGGERRRGNHWTGCDHLFLLLQTLSDLAKRHSRTITLSDAFVLFDRLMVLSKGDVMYSGRASDSLGWFEEHGCKLKKKTNPLDFLVDVTSVDNRSSDREDESRARVTILVQAWKDREHEKDIPPPLTGPVAHNISRDSQGGDLDEDASNIARPGPIKQTRILLHRSHLNVYRNYEQLAGFLIQSIGIGVFMGLTYFELQGTPAGIQSLKSTFPYIIADFISNLVPTTLPPTLYSLTHLPVWLRWIKWISTTFYSFRIVATTQFKGRIFACEGVTGVALTQCDGDNVLRGLDFSDTPLIVCFAAEIGIIVIIRIIWTHSPGGVKHAVGGGPASRDKESALTGDMDIARAKIDVEGPSGAGKSTILQLLSHRKLNAGPGAHFEMTGDILFNGLPATEDVRNSVAFVEQEDDYHLVKICNHFAVAAEDEQCVFFEKRKIARAEEVLLMLGLKDCADIYVGELLKGISGGEKRRISGSKPVQIITCGADDQRSKRLQSHSDGPLVDEPTSNVMECLKQIARSGRTVIVSIHQPRSDIFHSLDNVLILAKGGHAVFSGKRKQAVRIMESQGFPLPSLWFNPADHLLDLVTVDQRPGKTGESRARVDRLISFWNNIARKGIGSRDAKSRRKPRRRSSTRVGLLRFPLHFPWSGSVCFGISGARGMPSGDGSFSLHSLGYYFSSSMNGQVMSGRDSTHLLIRPFYSSLGPSGGQDRIGVVLQATSAIPFVGLISGIAVFPQDRQLFMHAYQSSAGYSCTTLILSYTLMEAPFQLLAGFLYAFLMNVAVGMQTSARIYFEYAITIWALQSLAESIAIIFGAFFNTMGIAVSLVSTTLSMVVQFSGIRASILVRIISAVLFFAAPSFLVRSVLVPLCQSTCAPYNLKILNRLQVAAQRLIFINECTGLQFRCSADDIAAGICTALSGEELPQYRKANWDSDRNSDIVENPGMGCIEGAYESGMRLLCNSKIDGENTIAVLEVSRSGRASAEIPSVSAIGHDHGKRSSPVKIHSQIFAPSKTASALGRYSLVFNPARPHLVQIPPTLKMTHNAVWFFHPREYNKGSCQCRSYFWKRQSARGLMYQQSTVPQVSTAMIGITDHSLPAGQ